MEAAREPDDRSKLGGGVYGEAFLRHRERKTPSGRWHRS
jgi:hypothetical protein